MRKILGDRLFCEANVWTEYTVGESQPHVYDLQVDSRCSVCWRKHPVHQAYLLTGPLMVFDPILKVEVYNSSLVFICPNFEHVNASFSPTFTRWDPLPATEDYVSKWYLEFANGQTDLGNLPYSE